LSLICAAIAIVAADNRAHAQEFRLPSVVDSGPEDIGPIGEPIVGAQDFGVIDADAYVDPSNPFGHDEYWSWQVLPQGLVYRSYLASTKDSRMYGGVNEARDESTFWDATVGARLGILRYGTTDYILPDGFQVDAEGSAQVRLDVPDDVDVRAVDFRGGVPITYGIGKHRFKTGYYHLSSHLGDEFLLKNVGYPRLNFARDVLLFGYSYYATPNLRFYGEAGWAFYTIVSEPWEFQFGIDYAPQYRTGIHGAPFFAINTHIRQELDYSGNLNVQFGWAWRADNGPQLLRAGFQYFNGMNSQYSFYNQHEDFFGFGVWYDF
jgi:hypothetical protein